jgi:hypothetical protein
MPIKFSKFVVTPKILIAALIVFFIGLGFFYLYRELSIFISNPRLVILDPTDNFSTGDKTITIDGVTEKDAKLSVNGQTIIVDENGKFSEVLVLQPGINTITIQAVNRFEKESERVISGEATFQPEIATTPSDSGDSQAPGQEDQNNQSDAASSVKVDVYGDTKIATISVKADDDVVFSGKISPGEIKSFEAQTSISVSADKGKYVGVKLDSEDLGLLGKDTKPVSRVFTAE